MRFRLPLARVAWAKFIGRATRVSTAPSPSRFSPRNSPAIPTSANASTAKSAISALDHPHICALYDVGEHEGTAYLVMQYLDGETLAERLGRSTGRPIPLSEALTITIQVADALEKAHRAGIVHRDLKPGNVMLTKAGAKLLDFGLAKAGPAPTGVAQDFSPAVAGRSKDLRHDDTMSPTISSPLTAQGTILGTFQYMAPEQLEGLDADARTDIFAFGAVLYEMLTGRKAFEGRSQASLIGAILEREPPPVASLQPATPASLDHVVRTCLAKNPDDRFQNAHDLFVQLKWIRDIGSQAASTPAPATRVRSRRGVVIAAVTTAFAATAAGVAVWMLKPEPSPPIRRFAIVLPEGDQFSATGRHIVAISPDGTRLVYVANQRLYIRTIDQLDATPIRGTEEGGADFARSPFFSPDGQWIGFWQGGQLKKVSVNGGAPVVLCAALNPWGASWGANGTILFGQGSQGISQVSASGGQASVLVSVDSKTESAHGPQMLPGGKAVLFTLASSITPSQT